MKHAKQPVRVRDQHDTSSPVARFNSRFALLITEGVGTMWCAYIFGVIALIGLPAALASGGEGPIAWIAQTFLQLVLLSVIMVGQSVQAKASDKRSIQTYEDTERILDAMNVKTEGGLKDVYEAIEELKAVSTPS